MHVARAPLSPTLSHACPAVDRYARGLPDLPPASVVAAQQRHHSRSVDNTNIPQAGYRGNDPRPKPTAGSRGILRAYKNTMPTTSSSLNTSFNTALNGAQRLRALKANAPAARGPQGHPHHPILNHEQARWFPSGSGDAYAMGPREDDPRIQTVGAQKKVRIMSVAEVIPSVEAQCLVFPSMEEPKPKRPAKRPAHLQIQNSNFARFGSGYPFRVSKELPPIPDMRFDEWDRVQREINPGYTVDAIFGSTSNRGKNIRRCSSRTEMKVAAMLAEKEKASFLSSSINTSSSKFSCLRHFVRKVHLSLTHKRPPKLPQVAAPVIKVIIPVRPKPKDDSFTWNIFKSTKARNDGYGREMYYNRKGYTR